MDDYPEELAVRKPSPFQREPFDEWWGRVGSRFPTVPRNVAKQWLWRHWGNSPHGWIPSVRARFSLQRWPSERLSEISIAGETDESLLRWGEHIAGNVAESRYRLPNVMLRRGTWPAPPIIIDHREPIDHPWSASLAKPWGLVEGHRRFALSRYLGSLGRLAPEHLVWVLSLAGGGASSRPWR